MHLRGVLAGCFNLPIDSGRLRGVPHYPCLCDVVSDEHHFIFACPVLDSVHPCFCHLFAMSTRSVWLFLWQEDLCAVDRFVWRALRYVIPFLVLWKFLHLNNLWWQDRCSIPLLCYNNGIPKTTQSKSSPSTQRSRYWSIKPIQPRRAVS